MHCRQPWATALAVAVFSVPAAAASMPASDRQFAEKAAAAGVDEVSEGRLAATRAGNPDVRSFAERMVADHTRAGRKLVGIATSEGVSLPAKLDKSAEKELDALTRLHGHAFDVAYMKHNVTAHEKAVKDFQKEAASGHDERIKRFAGETVPTLKEHLALARSAAQAVASGQ